jgi:hypothetical protein
MTYSLSPWADSFDVSMIESAHPIETTDAVRS